MSKWHIRIDHPDHDSHALCGRKVELAVSAEDFHLRIASDRCQRCEKLDVSKGPTGTGYND